MYVNLVSLLGWKVRRVRVIRAIKWFFICVVLHMFVMNVMLANDNTLTWKKLGIGIHNKGEIADWTYFGIKTPQEASEWISALKPLGGISYAGAARLWKQKGFTAQETKSWILLGIKTPERVKFWTNEGFYDPKEVEQWKDIGIKNPWEASQWMQAGVSSPEKAKEWIDASYSVSDTKKQLEKGYLSPLDVAMAKEEAATMEKNIPHDTVVDKPIKMTNNNEESLNVKVDDYTSDIGSDTTMTTEYQPSNNESGFQGFLLVYFIVMIVTMFKGYGENRSVVIFRDYNDLGLTFLIPASFVLIYYLFMMFGGNPTLGAGLALVVAVILFFILLKNTYEDNHKKVFPTILSIMTKVPLGMIWILSFMTMLNPGGKTARERRKNRGTALLIMGILTPIIGMLIANKEGSMFNPRDWVKGKRIGSIRKHL